MIVFAPPHVARMISSEELLEIVLEEASMRGVVVRMDRDHETRASDDGLSSASNSKANPYVGRPTRSRRAMP